MCAFERLGVCSGGCVCVSLAQSDLLFEGDVNERVSLIEPASLMLTLGVDGTGICVCVPVLVCVVHVYSHGCAWLCVVHVCRRAHMYVRKSVCAWTHMRVCGRVCAWAHMQVCACVGMKSLHVTTAPPASRREYCILLLDTSVSSLSIQPSAHCCPVSYSPITEQNRLHWAACSTE